MIYMAKATLNDGIYGTLECKIDTERPGFKGWMRRMGRKKVTAKAAEGYANYIAGQLWVEARWRVE